MKGAQGKNRLPLLLILLIGLFLSGISLPLTDGDTAYYGKIARNILDTGDWMTLRFKGDAMVDKPPLTMWLMAISFKLLGVNNLSARLWHILMAVGLVVITYSMARRFYSETTAFWSGLILATSAQFFYQQMVPQQDLPALFFYALALYLFIRFMEKGSLVSYYLMWVSMALAVITRGLVGVVFPVAVIVSYLFLSRLAFRMRHRLPFTRPTDAILHLLLGVGIFALVAAPWFVVEYLKLGYPFIDMFFGSGNTRFYQTPGEGMGVLRFLSYVPMLIIGFIPWSIFLWHTLRKTWRDILEGARNRNEGGISGELLFAAWALVGFLMPFLISWRVMRYLLPCFPPLAIMTARTIENIIGTKAAAGRRLATVVSLVLLGVLTLLALALVFLAGQFPAERDAYLPLILPFLVVSVAGMLFTVVLAIRGRMRPAVYALVCATFLSYATLIYSAERVIPKLLPWEELAGTINAMAKPDQEVILFGEGNNPFLDFYVKGPVQVVRNPRALHQALIGGGDILLIIQKEELESLQGSLPLPTLRLLKEFPQGVLLMAKPPALMQNGWPK